MPDAPAADPGLTALVETWKTACDDFVELALSLSDEEHDLPTDLAGWSVHDNIAHTAHLEAVLAGAPEETVEVAEAPHLVALMNYYTEQGVLARRQRSVAELAEEIKSAVRTRYAALRADPPTDPDAPAPKSPGDVGWTNGTLLSNRPLDVWMHEQDIRRATDRHGGYDGPAAAHVLDVFGRALPMIWGKRVGPPTGATVRVVVPDADQAWTVTVGDDGRAFASDLQPDVTVTLGAEDFVVLAGGRRTPSSTDPRVEGDRDLGRRLLENLTVTP